MSPFRLDDFRREDMSERHMYIGASRLLCDVLDEMRECDKVKNYGALASLIEEVQILGNRMESGLGDVRKIKEIGEQKVKYKKEIRELEEKLSKLDAAIKEAEERLISLTSPKKDKCIIPDCDNTKLTNSSFCRVHLEHIGNKMDTKA